MELPDLSLLPDHTLPSPEELGLGEYVSLRDMDYELALKVPGAIYSTDTHSVILPNPDARAATVALALQPHIAINHPELVELRDSAIQDVHPVDNATRVGIKIDAPVVHQTLLDEGHDWLEFDHDVNEPVTVMVPLSKGNKFVKPAERWPRQDTDLGYAAAMLNKIHAFALDWSRGLGKTLGTAAIIEANAYKSVLVCVPNSAKVDTWVNELSKRLPSHQLVVMGNGNPAKREEVLTRCQELHQAGIAFVLITHHETLALIAGKKDRPSGKGKALKDGWKRLKIVWDLFAVDESHKLKSFGRIKGSQFHRASLRVPAHNRLALTGSVYENSWEELYGTLHWLLPDRYKDFWEDWAGRHLDYVEGYGKICVGILPDHAQLMRDELGVFMIIREKLDRTTHEELHVDLGPKQRRAYDDLVDTMLARLEDDTLVFASAGVVQLTRLRQVAAGLNLLSDQLDDSVKIDRAVARIEQFPDHDFFIATWHVALATGLGERLKKQGYPVYVVTGDVPQRERDRRLSESRTRAEQRRRGELTKPVIVIGTIATVGESLNLQHLNHIIRMELSFNPALNRQVIDRCDRTGQWRPVFCDDIIADDTVDVYVIVPNLANKNAMRAILLGRGA